MNLRALSQTYADLVLLDKLLPGLSTLQITLDGGKDMRGVSSAYHDGKGQRRSQKSRERGYKSMDLGYSIYKEPSYWSYRHRLAVRPAVRQILVVL